MQIRAARMCKRNRLQRSSPGALGYQTPATPRAWAGASRFGTEKEQSWWGGPGAGEGDAPPSPVSSSTSTSTQSCACCRALENQRGTQLLFLPGEARCAIMDASTLCCLCVSQRATHTLSAALTARHLQMAPRCISRQRRASILSALG